MSKKIVFGISGTICSGKGVVAQTLKTLGCDVDTLSSVIREELKLRNIEPIRKNLQDEGNRLREEYGSQVLAERLLSKYSVDTKPLVIDGIRNIAEIDYLRENSRFTLIGVDAPQELRWQRLNSRKRDSDILSYDKFVADDARDRGHNEPLNGQQVDMCLAQADYLLYNDEEFYKLEDSKLYKELMSIYRKILIKN
jgi:dephospho-CoA kinase